MEFNYLAIKATHIYIYISFLFTLPQINEEMYEIVQEIALSRHEEWKTRWKRDANDRAHFR